MAANETLQSLDAALKTRWPQSRITVATYEDSTLLGLMPKKTFEGKSMEIAVRHSGQQGRSASFAKALANRTATANDAFLVKSVRDYAVGAIEGEAIETLKEGKESSLLEGIDGEMKTSVEAMKRSMGVHVWGSGTGVLGQVGSVAGGVITLKDKGDFIHFEERQTIGAASALASGSERAGVGTVTKVDQDGGKITYEGTITGIDAGDYLFIDGDFLTKCLGVRAWIPLVDPTSTPFLSVDRTKNINRLAGIRFLTYAGAPILQNLIAFLTHLAARGSYPDSIFLAPDDMLRAKLELVNKTVYERTASPDTPEVGYEGLVLPGYNRKVKVFEDTFATPGYATALKLDTWAFRTRGKEKPPSFLMHDGLRIRASHDSDDYLWRLGFYGNVTCDDPSQNGVSKL